MRKNLIVLLLLLSQTVCNAQFIPSGSESSKVRWSEIQTPTYRIIYPRGLDSLARIYAITLESAVEPVGSTIGVRPNESFSKPFPVVLRAFSGYSNGSVSWAPGRMELMTLPDVSSPVATLWHKHLVSHESRHLAQMQPFSAYPFRWGRVLTGQIVASAADMLYEGRHFAEGDAVATETALSSAGRGRSADFLEYYRVSFAQGQMRDYYKWAFPSQRRYTPDYYRSGYISVAGARALYDMPDYSAKFYQTLAESKGLNFDPKSTMLRASASGKSLSKSFVEICDSLSAEWHRDELARAPFMPCDTLVGDQKRFTEFTGIGVSKSGLFAVRQGLTLPSELVSIAADGSVCKISSLAAIHSAPQYSPSTDRIFWSECKSDSRWDEQSYSNIYFYEGYRRRSLTKGANRYYNPAPSLVEPYIAVVEYPLPQTTSGISRIPGSALGAQIVVMNAETGAIVRSYLCPDTLQPVEPVWSGDELYISAISELGYSIYRASELTDPRPLFVPTSAKIKQLRSSESGKILFVCDRTSVNELYSLAPSTGKTVQLTNTPHGAADFCLDYSAKRLYYSSLGVDGRKVCYTPTSALPLREAELSEVAAYPFADELSESEPVPFVLQSDIPISDPKPYSKFGREKFHSWLPIYFDYDSISDISFSSIGSSANVGATAFFQNELGNSYGTIAFKALDDQFQWRPSAHLSYTYSGLLPVFELKAKFNERNSTKWVYPQNDLSPETMVRVSTSKPSASLNLRSYIPVNLSSGGYSRGIIPSASFSISNDSFPIEARLVPEGVRGVNAPISRATLGLRAYTMENIPSSRVFPRWGAGAEIGAKLSWHTRMNAYAYAYAYLPGLWQTHGLNLSVLHEQKIGEAAFVERYANTTPRGFDPSVGDFLISFPAQTKLSADYVMPVLAFDWSIFGRFAIIRNFELTPHFDYSIYNAPLARVEGNLFSAGADFVARFNTLFFLVVDTKLGLTAGYLGGSLFDAAQKAEAQGKHYHIGFKFGVDF